MKLFISADIEGATGIASFSQCGKASYDYPDFRFARRMLTDDLNAVIRGARAGGATEIVVKDGHGNCKNLLIDQLEPGTRLICGQGPATDGMMDGVDSSFDAAMLVGYHAMAGALKAAMEHALVGGLHRFWINGTEAGEILTNSAVAAAYGVPTVLVAGDEATVCEAGSHIPGAQTIVTKSSYGKYMSRMVAQADNERQLEQIARRAMTDAASCPAHTIAGEVCMAAAFRTTEEADLGELVSGVTRKDGYSLEWWGPDLLNAHRIALNVFRLSMQGRSSVR